MLIHHRTWTTFYIICAKLSNHETSHVIVTILQRIYSKQRRPLRKNKSRGSVGVRPSAVGQTNLSNFDRVSSRTARIIVLINDRSCEDTSRSKFQSLSSRKRKRKTAPHCPLKRERNAPGYAMHACKAPAKKRENARKTCTNERAITFKVTLLR